jgi:hypothetical protein
MLLDETRLRHDNNDNEDNNTDGHGDDLQDG